MTQAKFDDSVAKRLEAVYTSAGFRRRRKAVLEAVRPQPNEVVLDVGCGPGFYVQDLAEKVGPDGLVVGVDNAPAMLAVAKSRADASNVRFEEGEATSLPVGDAEFDAALSVQVMEYVPNIPAAFSELRRVLKSGGRVIIYDTDFETFSWFSRDPERMRRVLDAFDEHVQHRSLPSFIAPELRRAGFKDVRATGLAFVDLDAGPDAYSGAAIPLVVNFVKGRGTVAEDEINAWAAELRDLSEAGEYYCACVHTMFEARKP